METAPSSIDTAFFVAFVACYVSLPRNKFVWLSYTGFLREMFLHIMYFRYMYILYTIYQLLRDYMFWFFASSRND